MIKDLIKNGGNKGIKYSVDGGVLLVYWYFIFCKRTTKKSLLYRIGVLNNIGIFLLALQGFTVSLS